MRSIKSQFILAISFLIIIVLSINAFFTIEGKKKELNYDIFQNAYSFAELTAGKIIDNYNLNYVSKSFVNFNKEMVNIKALNPDISDLLIVNYQGDVLYKPDSEQVFNLSKSELERIQANSPSVITKKTGRLLFLDKDDQGQIIFKDMNGKLVMPLLDTEQIKNIIFPYSDNKHSLIYNVSYENLQSRIRQTAYSIILLTIFGVFMGIFVSILIASSITNPLRTLTEGVKSFAKGKMDTRISVKAKNEVGTLASTFNKMAVDLEKSTQELIEKERMEQELSLASDIQKDLLPKKMPDYTGIDVFASVTPAEEVGGDCYDFVSLSDKKVIMYVGDVTGHGVPAGLVSAISNSLVEGFSDMFDNIKDLIVKLNHILHKKTRSNMFLTMVLCLWDAGKKEFKYVSAGHEQILIYNAKKNEVSLAKRGGLALGMMSDISKLVKEEKIPMEKGDVLAIYTDGIPEAWQSETKMYGMEKLQEVFSKIASQGNSKEIHDHLIQDVRKFMGNHKQMDDITLMVIKRN